MDTAAELAVLIEPVALAIWGKPTERSKTELRFGSKGSVKVDLAKGTWFDFEADEGGGVLDALKKRLGGIHTDQEAFTWLEDHRLWDNGHARRRGNGTHETRKPPRSRGELVATYPYVDESGALLFEVQRFLDRVTGDRHFRQRHRESGDWINNIKGVKRVPYRLPELLEALSQNQLVFIVEGEKDVDNCRDVLGVPATCNPMGAGKWPKMAEELNPYFEAADVVIVADNDKAGHDHAHEVAAQLAGVVSTVRVLELRLFWLDCPLKGDISDWIERTGGTAEQLFDMVDQLGDWTPAQADIIEPTPVEPPRRATPYDAPDPASIPKRAWLFGGHYIRQAATATVGPGGYGKTTLQLYEAIEMVGKGLRVWYLSGEDPKVELDRRIAAHCEQHHVDLKQLPGKLFVDDRNSFPFFIAKSPRTASVIFDDKALEQFEHAINDDKIDVVILDPFVSFHSVPENDNGCIDAVVKRVAAISYRTNCCIEISHHVRKPFTGQASMSVDDSRGGSAIINAVRSGRVINRMSSNEAEQAKVDRDHRHSYIRVDKGKRNMAPPEKATWFHLIGVPLPNDDNVQALLPWNFPGLMDGLSVEDTEAIRDLVRHKPFRADPRSDQWLGLEVARRMKLNVNDTGDIKKIQRIIGVWLSNGVFKKLELKDVKTRKQRMFYVGVDAKADEDTGKVVQLFPDKDDDNGHGDD